MTTILVIRGLNGLAVWQLTAVKHRRTAVALDFQSVITEGSTPNSLSVWLKAILQASTATTGAPTMITAIPLP